MRQIYPATRPRFQAADERVQHLTAQHVARRHKRVIEVIGWIAHDPELHHHPLGVGVVRYGIRHDLPQPKTSNPNASAAAASGA
jgi:hypothetical protein